MVTADLWAEFISKVASIVLGSVPGVAAVLFFLARLQRRLDVYLVEHEMLMGDYARRNNMELHELPTRSRRI